MIYIGDLQRLSSQWTERMNNPAQPSAYKDALMDCIYDLNKFISQSILDEMTEEDAREYILSQQADDYFSNLEPEEFYAAAI